MDCQTRVVLKRKALLFETSFLFTLLKEQVDESEFVDLHCLRAYRRAATGSGRASLEIVA